MFVTAHSTRDGTKITFDIMDVKSLTMNDYGSYIHLVDVQESIGIDNPTADRIGAYIHFHRSPILKIEDVVSDEQVAKYIAIRNANQMTEEPVDDYQVVVDTAPVPVDTWVDPFAPTVPALVIG